jgi:hypothetical protein
MALYSLFEFFRYSNYLLRVHLIHDIYGDDLSMDKVSGATSAANPVHSDPNFC